MEREKRERRGREKRERERVREREGEGEGERETNNYKFEKKTSEKNLLIIYIIINILQKIKKCNVCVKVLVHG